jgi:glyoxylase-like metal-dependent hydrolase (beta-lactamase superfamily II)
MTVPVSVTVLDHADWVVPRSLMRAGDGDDPTSIPTAVTVIRHGDDVLLVDTGVAEAGMPHPRVDDERAFAGGLPQRRHARPLPEVLAALAAPPDRVRLVINTHLHRDHCGGNHAFPAARFLVGAGELDYAAAPGLAEMAPEYDMALVAPDRLPYSEITDRTDVLGDGSVVVVPTPGHTPGHLSVLVRPTDGPPQLVTGDAVWTAAVREEDLLPGLLWDEGEYRRSRALLRRVAAADGAEWVYSHDPALFGGRDHVSRGLP